MSEAYTNNNRILALNNINFKYLYNNRKKIFNNLEKINEVIFLNTTNLDESICSINYILLTSNINIIEYNGKDSNTRISSVNNNLNTKYYFYIGELTKNEFISNYSKGFTFYFSFLYSNSIQVLRLNNNNLNDNFVIKILLIILKKDTTIKELSLSNNKIKGKCIKYIVNLFIFRINCNFKNLDLSLNSYINSSTNYEYITKSFVFKTRISIISIIGNIKDISLNKRILYSHRKNINNLKNNIKIFNNNTLFKNKLKKINYPLKSIENNIMI